MNELSNMQLFVRVGAGIGFDVFEMLERWITIKVDLREYTQEIGDFHFAFKGLKLA